MSFNTHARCDRCEEVLLVGDEDELLEEGWLTVCFGPESEDRADFCTLACMVKWAESVDAMERLQQVAARSEDDGDEPD